NHTTGLATVTICMTLPLPAPSQARSLKSFGARARSSLHSFLNIVVGCDWFTHCHAGAALLLFSCLLVRWNSSTRFWSSKNWRTRFTSDSEQSCCSRQSVRCWYVWSAFTIHGTYARP